jgi:hypothetical protein
MVMSRYQYVGQSHEIKVGKSFVRVDQFKYLGTALTQQNCMHKEMKSRWIPGMPALVRPRMFCLPACYITDFSFVLFVVKLGLAR